MSVLNLRVFFGAIFLITFLQVLYLGIQYRNPFIQFSTKKWSSIKDQHHNQQAKIIVETVNNNQDDWVDSAGNSTLGFNQINYITVPNRFDKDEAMLMQSTVSGLEINRFEAVTTDSIHPKGKGLPPSSSGPDKKPLLDGERACILSHSALWAKIIREKLPNMLILEEDSAWDKNIREINKKTAMAYNDLYQTFHSNVSNITHSPTVDDPFMSETWDIISFGTCFDDPKFREINKIFNDPDSPENQKWYDIPLKDQRVIRKSGYLVCTTAYAVSYQGAQKLLLRASLDMNSPLDIMMGDMINKDGLNVYSLFPPTFAQWVYKEGIGADSLGSSIHDDGNSEQAEPNKELWGKIHTEKDVWSLRNIYNHAKFRTGALQAFKNQAYN